MSKKCPLCKASTKTRSSIELSPTVWKSYHQCQNMHCGYAFITMTEVVGSLNQTRPVLKETIPPKMFPQSHYGNGQLNLEV